MNHGVIKLVFSSAFVSSVSPETIRPAATETVGEQPEMQDGQSLSTQDGVGSSWALVYAFLCQPFSFGRMGSH